MRKFNIGYSKLIIRFVFSRKNGGSILFNLLIFFVLDQNVFAGALLHSKRLKWILTSGPKMIVNGATGFVVQCSFCLLWLVCLSFLFMFGLNLWCVNVNLSSSRSSKGLGKIFTGSMSSDNCAFVNSHSFSYIPLSRVCAKPHLVAMSQRGLISLPRGDSPKYSFHFLRLCCCSHLVVRRAQQSNRFFAFCEEAAHRGLSLLFAGRYVEFGGNYLQKSALLDYLIKMNDLAIKVAYGVAAKAIDHRSIVFHYVFAFWWIYSFLSISYEKVTNQYSNM